MTVPEARVILGEKFASISDEKVQELIAFLVALATLIMGGLLQKNTQS